MSSLLTSSPEIPTLADLLDHLGGVSADRVRYYPLPGTATVDDVIRIEQRENRLCELIDGVLVEKPMGFRESLIAGAILAALRAFVVPRKLGAVLGADGMMQLFPGKVRIPDVSFLSRQRYPSGRLPQEQAPQVSPDLVVEVLSPSNTLREMSRKREEYFSSGTKLVWEFDLQSRTVAVYTTPDSARMLHETDSIDGGDVLPGFTLQLSSLFSELRA